MTLSNHIAWAYILTNPAMTVLYCRSTTDLKTRLCEHRTKQNPDSFTARYNVYKLVYYKGFNSIESAQEVERQIKCKSRVWKLRLINDMNPDWRDLTSEVSEL